MKNIIFDFGGVIINIDTARIGQVLIKKGIDNLEQVHLHLIENDFYNGLETGHVTPQQFRNAIKSVLNINMSDDDIDEAWNAIILDIPPERVRLLEAIRKNYSTYLLSNTNIIHYDYYSRYFAAAFGYDQLADIFDRAYFSHEMGLRKPNTEIFKRVLKESALIPEDTLFIDDVLENVEAAISVGMNGYHLDEGIELTSLFKDDRLAI